MIRLAILLLAIVAGLIAGPYFIGQKGYVLIALDNWTIELSVVSLAILVVGFMIVFLLVEWIVKRLYKGFGGSFSFFSRWRNKRKNSAYIKGMLALDEGHYVEAQKQFSRIDTDNLMGIDLLASAQAATKLNQTNKAKQLWQQAAQDPMTELAANLHLIRAYLEENNSKEALGILENLAEKHLQHPAVAQCWVEALAMQGRWQELKSKLKGWKKTLSLESYAYWMQQSSKGIFAEIASKQGALQLKTAWQELPRSDRKDPAQQAAYIKQLIGQDMHNDAAEALVDFQSHPEPQLVPLFASLRTNNPTEVIKKLESWLKHDEFNLQLLSALGHVAFHAKQYQLAEKVLLKRLNLGKDSEDLLLLAQIKEALGQPSEALELYKQSIKN
ncbi:heme biosynthesis HemY N-terminal domain-containing protein [Neptunicella sp.]|uniref:heme biosynthesis HemY N-terminal domain-containing protein n=1 Tax=Neptunicella sp. TaxID=2125986 RepID=UPI003F68EFAB